ncbi:MAG: hypothetical protein AAF467_03195 [Actinomycetota bacterium]
MVATAARTVARFVALEGLVGLSGVETARLEAVDRAQVRRAGIRVADAIRPHCDRLDERSAAALALLMISAVERDHDLRSDLLLLARHRGSLVVGRRWERPTALGFDRWTPDQRHADPACLN